MQITLHKLRRNQPLTATALAELERLLIDSGTGTAQNIARAGQDSHGLGLFVRGLVGLTGRIVHVHQMAPIRHSAYFPSR